jgi:hypothetical protein
MSVLSLPEFTPNEYARIVQVCERLHRDVGVITAEMLHDGLAGQPRLTVNQVRALLGTDRLVRTLAARGIEFTPPDQLTAKQLHALAIYADTSVPMTHRERLRAAKVTQTQWDGWMRTPVFRAHLERVSEERLSNTLPLANFRLAEAVDRGERWAIELEYAITGRYAPNQSGQNPQELFAALFEVLDEAGVDPRVMERVGRRLKAIATPGSAPARVAETVMLTPSAPPADPTPPTVILPEEPELGPYAVPEE